jgi:hypothetical protein
LVPLGLVNVPGSDPVAVTMHAVPESLIVVFRAHNQACQPPAASVARHCYESCSISGEL